MKDTILKSEVFCIIRRAVPESLIILGYFYGKESNRMHL